MLDKGVFPDFTATFRIFFLSIKYLSITYCLLGTEPGAGQSVGARMHCLVGKTDNKCNPVRQRFN